VRRPSAGRAPAASRRPSSRGTGRRPSGGAGGGAHVDQRVQEGVGVQLLQAGRARAAGQRAGRRRPQRLAAQRRRGRGRARAGRKQQRKVAADAGRKVRGGRPQRGVARAGDRGGQQRAQHVALGQQLRARLHAHVRRADRVDVRRRLRAGRAVSRCLPTGGACRARAGSRAGRPHLAAEEHGGELVGGGARQRAVRGRAQVQRGRQADLQEAQRLRALVHATLACAAGPWAVTGAARACMHLAAAGAAGDACKEEKERGRHRRARRRRAARRAAAAWRAPARCSGPAAPGSWWPGGR